LLSNAEITEALQVSGAHLSKVLQRLTRAGLIKTERGPRGGFSLNRPASEITILEIYEAIEGPLQERRCLLRKPICNGKCCIIGGLLRQIDELKTSLANLTLQEATEKSLG
jgi:Rrf2 family protein